MHTELLYVDIAVPKDKLPIYNKTISFGLYLSEPFVKDVANLKDDGSNDSSDGNYDIAYDGLYGDWNKTPSIPLTCPSCVS